ncbi:MAG: hypothetical protein ACYCVZ_03045 [Streptosporangiaceae bacterium]
MRRWRRAVVAPLSLAVVAGLAGGLAGPAAAAAGAPAGTQSAALALSASRVQETATGTARTLAVPGGGYVVVHSFGAVSMVSGNGRSAWQVSTQDLYRAWHVTWQNPGYTETPQLAWGTDPVDPLEFTGAGTGLLNDVNPVAVGDLNGHADVAVAETVGVNMTGESFCSFCTWPFDVPGSSLHLGTFVSVLDGRTGRMLYHELLPGYVTQLAITAGRLIVGEEDGDPLRQNGIGAWGSVSTLSALTISPGGTARQDWQYSTGVPWGRLLDLSVTGGGRPGIALAWSDTPLGLGVPGPPNGHLLMLDAITGAIRWQIRTPGYPTLTAADNHRRELVVVQQSDPTRSVSYSLSAVRYASGSVAVSNRSQGALALSLAVGRGARDGWAVGAIDATVSNGYYNPTRGRVTLTNAATGAPRWSVVLPDPTGEGPPLPGGLVVTGNSVVAGSWLGFTFPTAARPLQEVDGLTALSYATGAPRWSSFGDPGDPLSLSAATSGTSLVRAVNSHQDVQTYGPSGSVTVSTAAGPGDIISATTASIASPRSTDLVTGNEDGDVTALAGRALAAGNERVLWQTHLPGPVQHITRTLLDGREVLVAAATSAIGVLDARTGRLLRLIETPGTFAYTATVISAGGAPAVVVPGSSLTAYALGTGARLWNYPAPAGAWFSDAAYASGTVAAEYSNAPGNGHGATEMAAIGLSAATGSLAWSKAANPSVVWDGQLWNGTFASPDIAGAGGNGVAFAWTDSGGDGQIDVRDITTGALLYRDTAQQLSPLTQMLASPGLGLIGVSASGAALVTPTGAKSSYYPSGMSGALATDAAGNTALLTADAGVQAFGVGTFTGSSPTLDGSEVLYDSGLLVGGDFAGNGTRQVVAMPADWTAYQVVEGENGYLLPPNLVTLQHGLAVITLTASGTTAGRAGLAAGPAAAAERYPAPPRKAGTTVHGPVLAVPPGLRPVGQAGSAVPSPEPRRNGTVRPGVTPIPARHTISSAGPAPTAPPGYSPAQMTAHLGLTGDGAGQTIAIVDAYNDPNIVSDTQTFSQQYGLPGVCGAGGARGDCFNLEVKQQSASAGSNGGWALETSLDVEWAHAIAPKATIELIETKAPTFAALFRGVTAAVASHPAAVSMSWGIAGEFSDETYYDHFCAVSTTVCVVASGDYGHPGSYPAYSPAVVAVGGTTQNLAASGSVTSETTWSSSGGGQSWVEPKPTYQDNVQNSQFRQMPDVAFDADPGTGVAVYDSASYGFVGWWEVGGTSVGAPSWSAILADADQLRAARAEAPLTAAGFGVQRAIYSLPSSVLAPITTGPDNGFCPVGCAPGAGYDEITGLGSPRFGIDSALAAATGAHSTGAKDGRWKVG